MRARQAGNASDCPVGTHVTLVNLSPLEHHLCIDTKRLIKVNTLAKEAFESADLAQRWFDAPHVELGGSTPRAVCESSMGTVQVEVILLRIIHGIVG